MIRINDHFNELQGSYLFAEVGKRVNEFQQKNPSIKLIKLGIGDVTEPLSPAVVSGLKKAVDEMGGRDTFKGYPPYEGYEFLRKIISETDFVSKGISISPDEIFISTGAKEDTANIQELFSQNVKLAITDPVYPVYVDSNVMAGRTGEYKDGKYDNIVYLPCTMENDFTPEIPKKAVDLIYLCFPNNPTGQTINKKYLKLWVDYARKNKALILYDSAYEAYIREDNIPHSIFEIDGAREVAIEFRSLSKTAGFTGTRCSYTIIPNDLMVPDKKGKMHQMNKLWLRRQSTKSNGVAYIIQKGAYQVFTEQGRNEAKTLVDFYLGNAEIIGKGLTSLNIKYSGGVNSPYIWLQVPKGLTSWQFFDELLNQCNVVGTPGSGFGKCGEGFFRLTGFGKRENIIEAVEKLNKFH